MNKILVGFLSMSLVLMFSLVSTDMNRVEAASKHAKSKSYSKKDAKRRSRSKRKSRSKKKRRRSGGGCQTLSSDTLHKKASPYSKSISNASKKYGVSKNLIRAVITIESCFRSKARGALGEKGLMQLMPKTAKRLRVRNGYNASQNIHGGAKYLGFLLNRYNGNMTKAIAAYNAGEGRIDKGRIPNMRYVRKVLHAYKKFSGGKAAKTVKVKKKVSLKHPDRHTEGKSSRSKHSDRKKAATKSSVRRKSSSRHTYVVQEGDTVYEVMRQTGMPVKSIIRMNRLKKPYNLKVGQRLRTTKSTSKKTRARKSKSTAANTYVVQAGDTVYNVMRQTGVPVKKIIRLNNLSVPYDIGLGQKLRLR